MIVNAIYSRRSILESAPLLCFLLVFVAPGTQGPKLVASERLFSDEGYRVTRMLAPTKAPPPGVTKLKSNQLLSFIEDERSTILVDVLPLLWRNTFIQREEHFNIPDSFWLPNVGFGNIEPKWLTYLETKLMNLTQDNKARPIVVYCKADCWHSWNAAKRILSLGYTQVYWYPLGVNGWLELGQDLKKSDPETPNKIIK